MFIRMERINAPFKFQSAGYPVFFVISYSHFSSSLCISTPCWLVFSLSVVLSRSAYRRMQAWRLSAHMIRVSGIRVIQIIPPNILNDNWLPVYCWWTAGSLNLLAFEKLPYMVSVPTVTRIIQHLVQQCCPIDTTQTNFLQNNSFEVAFAKY